MNINDELVSKLATLAKLNFSDTEKESLKEDFQQIITFFEKLNQLDTEGVSPLIYMNPTKNVFRPDKVVKLNSKKEVLKNAPVHDEDYFKVPKMIQK